MRIYVAGHTGLVGKAVTRTLADRGHDSIGFTSDHTDLRDRSAVAKLYDEAGELDGVVVAAARVGGIGANAADPVGFLLDNVRISTNVIELAQLRGVPCLVNLGSSCIYPRECPQPIREEHLMTGPLEQTNEGYGVAKIAALELTEFYRRAGYGYTSLMPTNLYGPGDTYDEARSHVIPAMILKFCRAIQGGDSEVALWGTGRALREFLYVQDLADAIVALLERGAHDPWMNIGSGEEIQIHDLAAMIARLCGYAGTITWNAERPDGTPRKLLDSSRIRATGWRPQVGLEQGLIATIADYRSRVET